MFISARPVRLASCPFNSLQYAAGLGHLGTAEMDAGKVRVFRRPVPETDLHDGVGAWPYVWIDDQADIATLYEGYRHLVTLAVVTQPGFVPRGRGDDATILKQHFVYDPALPAPPLSRRARGRLAACEKIAAFEVVAGPTGWREFADLYEGLKVRRALKGAFFEKGARHFQAVAECEGSIFFRVAGSRGLGAMACGVVFADMLQVLHMGSTESGLRWDASYLLMHGLQQFARANRLRLFTGGMPDAGSEGLRVFKSRWANAFEPVYLMKIVNDPIRYRELCAARPAASNYFPAYRDP